MTNFSSSGFANASSYSKFVKLVQSISQKKKLLSLFDKSFDLKVVTAFFESHFRHCGNKVIDNPQYLLNWLWTLKLNQLLYSTYIQVQEREKDAHVRFSFTWLERLRSYLIEVFGDSQNHKLTNYKKFSLFNILLFAVQHTPKYVAFKAASSVYTNKCSFGSWTSR